jgi:hypothetical protein
MNSKTFIRTACVLLCSLLCSSLVAQSAHKSIQVSKGKAKPRDWTLREFRDNYLDQRILILQGNDFSGSLGEWATIWRGPDGSFSVGADIEFQYKDQTPKIISIRESSRGGNIPKRGQRNALGEVMTDDEIVNPYTEIIVQFDDGRLATYSNFITNIRDRTVEAAYPDPNTDYWNMEFMLVSVRDAHAEIIARNLPSTIGQKVYAVYETLVFGLDLTPADLLDIGKREGKRVWDVPLLTPLTIVAAKYNERFDFIVWKLRLPDGREVLSAARYRDEDSKTENDNSFLGRSIGTMLLKVPSNLTPREITAIRSKKIFRGMSRRAVFYSWGVNEGNDYGHGGRQLVYENQYVYLDNSGKVTNWQSLGR